MNDLTDLLPEQTEYRDEGCNLAPSCLGCPFERCRYDDWERHPAKSLRDSHIVMLRAQGAPPAELAQRFRLSRRTIHRILKRG
ncbi:MAG: helix-turn-helix domain-containing protein [Chloroflexi bacterium]|nr:helix-turn-helix domain-containing protein [Chloroflexota bacterium]